MADMRISEDFIIGQASLVNEIEDQRETFNDALKSAWSDYREELKLLGLTGKEIAAEVAALKSAISDTRMTAEDRAKAEEKADGKDGYLAILSGPRARARIREAKSEPQPTKAAGQVEQRAALAICGERVAATSSVENEAAEISTPITEQQDAPHPASDLANPPSLSGQVATPSQAKTSADGGATEQGVEMPADSVTGEASRLDAGRTASATSERMDATAGETAPMQGASEATEAHNLGQAGSTPAPATNSGVVMETAPFYPVTRPRYHDAFPEVLGKDYDALVESIRLNGVREPIIRMGTDILDGWARYNAARSLGIAYPVVPYLGNDVLLDIIGWQRRDRQFTPAQERSIAAKLAKAVPHRADDIMQAFGLETAEAAE